MKSHVRILVGSLVLASAACGAASPTQPATHGVNGTLAGGALESSSPDPMQATLSGSWVGTADGYPIAVAFNHTGTSLTGVLTEPPNYGGFDLVQAGSTGATLTFTGTFVIKPDGSESCSQTGRPGSMSVDTTTGSMSGSFTGINFDCRTETNTFALKLTPTNAAQCKHGGWARFTSPRSFKNQGDCMQFVITGK